MRFNSSISLASAGSRSDAPSSTWMRQVPQVALRQEKRIGASCASHTSRTRPPAGAETTSAGPWSDSKTTTGTTEFYRFSSTIACSLRGISRNAPAVGP